MGRQAELARLGLEIALGGARAGDQEAHVAEPLDHARERVEREVEALLVDEPPDEQHEPLLRRRVLRPQPRKVGDRLEIVRVDAVGHHRHAVLVDPEHLGDVAAHVVRAGDHAVGRAHHPPFDAVDVALRMLVDPALVAAVLGRVDGHEPRAVEAPRQLAGRARHQPVVGVDEVERQRVAERGARGAHVVVHRVDPAHERVEVVLGELRLAHAVHGHAVAVLDRRQMAAAARQDVHFDTEPDEALGELADVPGEPASTIGGYSHERIRTRVGTGPGSLLSASVQLCVPTRR